jgi:hypothetical protein
MTNFMDIIRRLMMIKNSRRSRDWNLSPSSGNRGGYLLWWAQSKELVSISGQTELVWVTSSYLLRVICDWFSSAYLLRVHCVPVFFILFDLTTSVCPEIETSSLDWAHQSRHPPLLPDHGDRFQSPKRRVFLIIIIRWIMSIKFVT